ncbi:MAG TPA: trypsin-like peptidase domain-containing protein [Terriglobia bacterium]|nr:trypsin-like peptidase domain-containing protein [Terriglobia bacterium]
MKTLWRFSATLLVPAALLVASGKCGCAQDQPSDGSLLRLSAAYERLVRQVSPTVVQILATGYGTAQTGNQDNAGLVLSKQQALGSGVVVDPDGYIVTNAHVVRGAQQIRVVFPPQQSSGASVRAPGAFRLRTVAARVVGLAPEIDLALLKVDMTGLRSLAFARYADLHQGEIVFAFGSPAGFTNSVTAGVVSAVARQIDPDSPLIYIQTDAAINPGNSGGPLVNAKGELVGINTFIVSESGGSEGLNFAIPSGLVAVAYPQLRKYGHIHRGRVGLAAQTITPTLAEGLGLARDWGVMVSDVLPGGPADKAGVRPQDIILSVDGLAVNSLPVYLYSTLVHPAGEPLALAVLRGSQVLKFRMPVIEPVHPLDPLMSTVSPETNLVRQLGILGIDVSSKLGDMVQDLRIPSGVVVIATAPEPGSPDLGLSTGDVIHAVNGNTIRSLDELRSAMNQIKPDGAVVLQIERDGSMKYLAFRSQ